MIFGMFKKTVDDTVDEVMKTRLAKEVLTQIYEAHTIAKTLSNELIDVNRKLAILYKAHQDQNKTLEILHFLTTLGLLGVVIYKVI